MQMRLSSRLSLHFFSKTLLNTSVINAVDCDVGNFVCDDGDLSQAVLKVVVTVTTTFSKWNLQFFKQF